MNTVSCTHLQQGLLQKYQSMLFEWSENINLIAASTRNDIWNRHIRDCLQICDRIPASSSSVVDVGSGAGLPGIIVAIMKNVPVTLMEKDAKKVAFLHHLKTHLCLKNVDIIQSRWEESSRRFSIVTARGLAELSSLLGIMNALCDKGGQGVFLKGQQWETELATAQKAWSFDYETQGSMTDERSAIISIRNLRAH